MFFMAQKQDMCVNTEQKMSHTIRDTIDQLKIRNVLANTGQLAP